MAGGVKDISSGSYYSKKYHSNRSMPPSKLHDAKTVVLMAHVTCGAYGRTFDTNEKTGRFTARSSRRESVSYRGTCDKRSCPYPYH